MKRLIIVFWTVACLISEGTAQSVLPEGTELEIRLKTAVGSSTSRVGDRVEAVLVAPVLAAGNTVLPAGLAIRGNVKEAQGVDDAHPRAILKIDFSTLLDNAGKEHALPAKLAAVDNAREGVDDNGRITGILASETLSSRMDQGLEKLGAYLSGWGSVLQQAKKSLMRETNPEIAYPAGVELILKLTQPAQLEKIGLSAGTAPIPSIEPNAQLLEIVNAQPFRTEAESPPQPSDVTNLMFLGAQEQIEQAFALAGWTTADPLTGKSKLETVRAVAEGRGYNNAPVSILLLEGQKPQLVFQKQNNTFAKRHHLRIWKRPGTFIGREVWVCAATHDIGIEFSPQNRTFIHKIDPQIDRERDKVRRDLFLTSRIKGYSLVERAAVPKESKNATGDNLATDGKMAVLLFER